MIKGSARKRGYSDSELLHAVANAIRVWPHDGYDMVIWPRFDDSLLEVGVNSDGDIFHAMPARKKFL
ncbi:MAG: hypothetical protein QM597_07010 [Aeromicrobium sp.]|uniref:hypothetical protein n=1 Tax=Aeromicrobium sp. TaxID=1871063 RepID=UPI0039E2A86A